MVSKKINYWEQEFGSNYKTEVCNYIEENKIEKELKKAKNASNREVEDIIDKSLDLKGLTPEEAAILLQIEDEELINKMLKAAREVKERIYGKRLVVFAPLYFANKCVNNCLYCGFRCGNKEEERKKLTTDQIESEVKTLEREGHKRLLVLTGESPDTDIDYLLDSIETAYNTTTENGEIRRINVEVAPLSKEDFKKLKTSKIGTYTCFQETYHRPTYQEVHPSGPKSNYDWRLTAMDRAQEAGIDDIGIGALFGLYDYRFEVMALLLHADYLDKKFGVGPHTISIPRLNPAPGTPLDQPPHPVSDEEFRKLTAILRLAVPYTGIILTTRESEEMRNELFLHGVSQISAGSRTSPGGYEDSEESEENKHDSEQFSLHDVRPLEEIAKEIAQTNHIPSFCTACYRLGRTGEDFMELAKPGEIHKFCKPNAMMTFKEYLQDYGTEESRKIGNKALDYHLQELREENPKLAEKVKENLNKIENGEHDLLY